MHEEAGDHDTYDRWIDSSVIQLFERQRQMTEAHRAGRSAQASAAGNATATEPHRADMDEDMSSMGSS